MTEVPVREIDSEIKAVCQGLQTSWSDFAIYCKAKIFECGINGAVSSYTYGGRTVAHDLQWWERALALANKMSAAESCGGIAEQPISFRSRR